MVAQNFREDAVAIVSGARTPFSKMGTALRAAHVTDLARRAFEETLARGEFPGDRLDEAILGNVVMPADAANPARVSALYAGIPQRVPALTVQRNCASGMEALAEGASRIRAKSARAILAGGAESMSQVPLLYPLEAMVPLAAMGKARNLWQKAAAVATLRPRHFKPVIGLECGLTDPTCGMIMGKTAELIASEFGISRGEQDAFAQKSHEKALEARKAGRFDDEIVPMFAGKRFEPVTADNGPREGQSIEALAKLKPIFDRRDGTVTVGNACQVTDGAAAMLLMDSDLARAEGREILGFIRGYAYAALDPARMGLGPVFAIDQLLKQTGVALQDVDLFEINEAFAAQVIACMKAMESDAFAQKHLDRQSAPGAIDPGKLNVNGGAIALGHPVGATGARIVLTLLLEMKRRNVNLGIASLCVGGGQGAAMLLERR